MNQQEDRHTSPCIQEGGRMSGRSTPTQIATLAIVALGIVTLCWMALALTRSGSRSQKTMAEERPSEASSEGSQALSFVEEFLLQSVQPDHFADNLKLPKGISLTEPSEAAGFGFDLVPGTSEDTFQAAIRNALKQSGVVPADVGFQFPALSQLRKEHAWLLARYLAAHPGWRVYEEHQKQFALRRWMNGDQWLMNLGGYYSSSNEEFGPSFASRTTICFSGETHSPLAQRLSSEPWSSISTVPENDFWKSHVMVPVEDLLVEQFEQSNKRERRLTYAAFSELEREFAALLASPTWETAKNLLPKSSILKGTASINLTNRMQGGIYNALIRCNPGAPGRIYLKAFELTRGTQLSENRLQRSTNEWVGWSADTAEQFMSEMHFTIYEGEWDQFYGARFEVWFKPDEGGPERKLIERCFKIQGWTR